jgi:hypothetical protein
VDKIVSTFVDPKSPLAHLQEQYAGQLRVIADNNMRLLRDDPFAYTEQTPRMMHEKGTYGAAHGVYHSLIHAAGTLIAFIWLHPIIGLVTAFFDFLLHYHIDWTKSNINKKYNYTQDNPKFWIWFGLDQLAHQFTYIVLIWWIFFGL